MAAARHIVNTYDRQQEIAHISQSIAQQVALAIHVVDVDEAIHNQNRANRAS